MKMSKSKAFIMCFWAIIFIFSIMVFVGFLSNDYTLIPVIACLTALVSVTGGYIGLQITDHHVMGKSWNQDMYNALNGNQNIEGDNR